MRARWSRSSGAMRPSCTSRPARRSGIRWRSTARCCAGVSTVFMTARPLISSAFLPRIRPWCWLMRIVTRSRMRSRPSKPCSANLASPVPSSRLTPCTVKKTFEHAAAAGAHLIAQVKANQPTLYQRIAEICQSVAPVDQVRTTDKKRRSRDEIRLVEVFDRGAAYLDDTEWADHVTAIVRVSRDTLKRITTTGLWEGTSQVAYFIADIALPASVCAQAIRSHWGIENRLHYVRDVSFREDDSRIRCNPGIFARLRSFAANIQIGRA